MEPQGFDWTPVLVVVRDALTVLVPAVVAYMIYLLRKNQQTTEEAKAEAREARTTAENGHAVREALIAERDSAIKMLATERDAHTATRAVADTYRDIFRYVNSLPDGRKILLAFEERRKIAVHDAAADALFDSIAHAPPAMIVRPPDGPDEDLDDPTGFDAGRQL